MIFDPLGYAVKKADAVHREMRNFERTRDRETSVFQAEMRAALLVIHSRLDSLELWRKSFSSLVRRLSLILIPCLLALANVMPEKVLKFIAKVLAAMLGGG